MNLLELIGIIVVAAILLFITGWLYGLYFVAVAFAGWRSLDKLDWFYGVAWSAMLVVGWYYWWEHIGSRINVSFG